jgi:site-specific DNA recombinase
MRAVIGARVSSDEQAEEGYGLPVQIGAAQRYIEHHGYTLVTSVGFASDGIEYIPGVFQEDYTGKTAIRPAINAMLETLKAHRIQVVVFHRTDRLGRKARVQDVLEEEFAARGVRVEYVTAKFDTSNRYGRAMRRVQGAFDELDYEGIIERLKDGKTQKAKSGSVIAARPPYGYCVVPQRNGEGKRILLLQINEDEGKWVRLIFEWYVYGDETGEHLSIKRIAERLSTMGAPIRHASKKATGIWSISHIFDILRSETYIGKWYYNRTVTVRDPETDKPKQVKRPREEWIEVAVPALVSEEAFKLGRERAAQNAEQSKRNRKRTYLFSGMMRCMTCGQRFAGKLLYKGTTKQAYRCGLRTRRILPHNCPEIDYPEASIDHAVWEWISDLVTHPERVEQALYDRQAEADGKNNRIREHLTATERVIAQKKVEQNNLIRLYAKTPIAALEQEIARFEHEIADHEQERARIAAQLLKVLYTPEDIENVKGVCAQIAKGLACFTLEEKRQTYELLELSIKLTIEEGEQIAYAECVIDLNEKRLIVGPSGDIASASSRLAGPAARSPFRPTSP